MNTNSIAWADLPAVITAYLPAHQKRDTDTALTAFAADAEVTDEGHTHRGRDEIRAWLSETASEYTFTTEFVGASRTGEQQFDVVQRLEGDFPGGSVDLHYRFALDGPSITNLVIET